MWGKLLCEKSCCDTSTRNNGIDIFRLSSENVDKAWRRECWNEETKTRKPDSIFKLRFASNYREKHFRKVDVKFVTRNVFFLSFIKENY